MKDDSLILSPHNSHSLWVASDVLLTEESELDKKPEACLPKVLTDHCIISPYVEAINMQNLKASGSRIQLFQSDNAVLYCLPKLLYKFLKSSKSCPKA